MEGKREREGGELMGYNPIAPNLQLSCRFPVSATPRVDVRDDAPEHVGGRGVLVVEDHGITGFPDRTENK